MINFPKYFSMGAEKAPKPDCWPAKKITHFLKDTNGVDYKRPYYTLNVMSVQDYARMRNICIFRAQDEWKELKGKHSPDHIEYLKHKEGFVGPMFKSTDCNTKVDSRGYGEGRYMGD